MVCHSPQCTCKPSQTPAKQWQKYMKRIQNWILWIQVYACLSFSHVFKHFSVPPRFLKKLHRIMACDTGMTEKTPLILIKLQQTFPLPVPLLLLKALSTFSAQYRLVKLDLLPEWVLARSAEFSPSQLMVNLICPYLVYSSAIISHYT